MLPPVRELVLQNNPRFAELHGRLSRDFLNRDGSTKSTASEVLRGNAAKEVPNKERARPMVIDYQ